VMKGELLSWNVRPLGVVDLDDSQEGRVGARRKFSDDNLFEIVPQLLITPSLESEVDEVEGDGDRDRDLPTLVSTKFDSRQKSLVVVAKVRFINVWMIF
jgi:hypothetical protein